MSKAHLILTRELREVIDESFSYLNSQQTLTSGKCGWHHFLESGKIGTIATSQILLLYKTLNKPIPNIDCCIGTLNNAKISMTWKGHQVSGWSYISSGPRVPCTAPTCWVGIASQLLGFPNRDLIESDVLTFLYATNIVSEDGIAWGHTPWTEARVAPTCLALKLLTRAIDKNIIDKDRVVRWLLSARNAQKVWGQSSKSDPTLTHTALAVIALRAAGYLPSNPVLIDAYAFIEERLQKWLTSKERMNLFGTYISGIHEIAEVPANQTIWPIATRIQYYYNPIQLAALALATNFHKKHLLVEAVAIESVKDWYVNRWIHPWLKEHQHGTSWSMSDHLLVLDQIHKFWSTSNKSGAIYFTLFGRLHLFRVNWLAGFLKTVSKFFATSFFRGIVTAGLILLIMKIVLGMTNLPVLIAISLGVLSNFLYDLLKKASQ